MIKSISFLIMTVLLLTACSSDNDVATETDFEYSDNKNSQTSIWNNLNRSFPSSPTGQKIGVSCHNCYAPENSARLSPTLAIIHAAQDAGADLIELDVYLLNNTVYVNHIRQNIGTLKLEDILKDSKLRYGNQPLFIEIKEANDSSIGQKLISLLDQYGYISSGRPVVIRSFSDANLDHVKNYLPTYSLRNYVHLSRLFGEGATVNDLQWHNDIRAQQQRGRKMVEFNYRSPNLMSKIMYAKSLGLATNLYTLTNFAEVYVAGLRNELDAVTIEAGYRSKTSNINLSRRVILENSQLVYSNFALQSFSQNRYTIYDQNQRRSFYLSSINSPTLENLNTGRDRFGKSLVFNTPDQEFIRTWDRDNTHSGGFLVTAVVNFDDLNLASGETQAIVQKADAAGFALELHRAGSGNTVLRFGIHRNGRYHYSSLPVTNLNTNNSYLLIGAYDGNGGVHLWVDENHAQPSSTVIGGVNQNNSPIIIGADPQGPNNTRFHFSGKIQMVNVIKWNNH